MELDDEEQWEPYESRGSSTVLRGAGAEMLRPTHSKYRELDSITDSLILTKDFHTNGSLHFLEFIKWN